MKAFSSLLRTCIIYKKSALISLSRPTVVQTVSHSETKVSAASRMSTSTTTSTFPPDNVRKVVSEVVNLLKERGESVSVAETVSLSVDCLMRPIYWKRDVYSSTYTNLQNEYRQQEVSFLLRS